MRFVVAVAAVACATPLGVHGFGTTSGQGLVGVGARGQIASAASGSRRVAGVCALRAKVATPVKTGGGGGDDGTGDDAVVRPWPAKESRVKDYSLLPGEVPVRFINSPGRYPSGMVNTRRPVLRVISTQNALSTSLMQSAWSVSHFSLMQISTL
jgi:hypothetical protein